MYILSLLKKHENLLPYLIVSIFTIAYLVLTIVRFNHFEAFGYDLGINDQTVWRYSTFQYPITTLDPFPELPKLATHVELVYLLISPFYWIWSDARTLLIIEAVVVCISAIPLYRLAVAKKLHPLIPYSLLLGYLLFYGVQNALWFDAHSATFAASFVAWFIYFLDQKKLRYATVFFIFAITAKENIAILTGSLGIVYYFLHKDKKIVWFVFVSLLYLLFIYFIYYPFIMNVEYLYKNSSGLFSGISFNNFVDTPDKRSALFYSFASFGFLPFAALLFLIPVLADFATYFVLASDLTASHGIYMHYRVTLTPLLILATIYTIHKFQILNKWYTAVYLLVCSLVLQYHLHLPLSYLSKQWFWDEPAAVQNIQAVIRKLPENASVVSQNNISPHISQRGKVYTLYPETKRFQKNSPCNKDECNWFRWHNDPEFLIVDTSENWDARHLLTDREDYIKGIKNLEKAQVIEEIYVQGNAVVYKIVRPLHEVGN